jgi:hypothetical protein
LQRQDYNKLYQERNTTLAFLRRPSIGLGAGTTHQHRPFTVAQAVSLEVRDHKYAWLPLDCLINQRVDSIGKLAAPQISVLYVNGSATEMVPAATA